MKNIFLALGLAIWAPVAFSVCTDITRTNVGFGSRLDSAAYNLDMNTAYNRVNALPGDCITDETVTSAKIQNLTIVNADISGGALIERSKLAGPNYALSSSISFNTTSATPVDVTNSAVTIVTTGKPVEISLVGQNSIFSKFYLTSASTHSGYSIVELERDGSVIDVLTIGIAQTGTGGTAFTDYHALSEIRFVDLAPSAASHTYTLNLYSSSTSIDSHIAVAKLLAREL